MTAPKHIPIQLEAAIVGRIAKNLQLSQRKAEERLQQCLLYWKVADQLGEPSSPSIEIDKVWHIILENPDEYDMLNIIHYGRTRSHTPCEPYGHGYLKARELALGINEKLDPLLWPNDAAQASQCS
jgi:hypothetical protein